MSEDHAAQINAMHEGTFAGGLGLVVESATRDEVTARVVVRPDHRQPHGIVHGGVYASIVETAASIGAALDAMPKGKNVVGLENQTSFVRAVRDGVLFARATPVTRGLGRSSGTWSSGTRRARSRRRGAYVCWCSIPTRTWRARVWRAATCLRGDTDLMISILMSAIPSPIQALLDLFGSELRDVRFPDVDASTLAASAADLEAAADAVAAAQAALDDARATQLARQDALTLHAQRALAYARVYAETSPALAARLETITLPRLTRRARPEDDAASSRTAIDDVTPRRPRGRPRKTPVEATLPLAAPAE